MVSATEGSVWASVPSTVGRVDVPLTPPLQRGLSLPARAQGRGWSPPRNKALPWAPRRVFQPGASSPSCRPPSPSCLPPSLYPQVLWHGLRLPDPLSQSVELERQPASPFQLQDGRMECWGSHTLLGCQVFGCQAVAFNPLHTRPQQVTTCR